MNRSRVSLLPAVLVTAALLLSADRAAAQEVALTPLESKEVAKGYRADALKLKAVVNDKGETITTSTLCSASATLQDLLANSSLFPSMPSNWTIPPTTSYCQEQAAPRWKNYRFSSAIGESPQAVLTRR
jgi:hypothetical protein